MEQADRQEVLLSRIVEGVRDVRARQIALYELSTDLVANAVSMAHRHLRSSHLPKAEVAVLPLIEAPFEGVHAS